MSKKSASWSAVCVRLVCHENRTKRHFHVPRGYEAQIVEIGHLPLYNFDYDDPAVTDFPTPSSYTEFRETIKASAGVLFVTSETTVPSRPA